MRRRWKIVVGAAATVLIGGGLIGWWYADRTYFARKAEGDAINAERANDYPRAERLYSTAIRKFPADSPSTSRAYLSRALVRTKLNRPTEAIEDLDQAVAIRPDWATPYLGRAKVLYSVGRYPEARVDLQATLARLEPPSNGAIEHYYLGLVAERLGELDTAMAEYQKTAEIDRPSRDKRWLPRSFAGMSRILRAKGDKDLADFMRDSALQLNPSVPLEIE